MIQIFKAKIRREKGEIAALAFLFDEEQGSMLQKSVAY
jgi:hypothetical protein